MKNLQTARTKLVFEIEHLPNSSIVELQNFIQYLKFKQLSMIEKASSRNALRPEDDPMLGAFGLIDVPPFSDAIDEALYGAL
ncbi:hypothetical protein U14_01447 [Candidatus Moduliflexus flocculans]|uniref:DUF2281 domain-containing protein n=1 Tax=Candidatus Moduliflexus flocculans TaxID=1499966 RepID=A0A0S6VWK1_9BACT|nr:hypothetical protein U14_01447 [Candidatus Moduliflexus flocculans]